MIAELFLGLALVGASSFTGWLVGTIAASAQADADATFARFGMWLGAIVGCMAASGVLS